MITLSQVKTFLGITSTTNDNRLNSILDSVNDEVLQYIGDYTLGEKTIQIPKKSIKDCTIGLMHVNATSLTSIDWKTIEESEYMIQDDGTVYVKNLSDYITSDFPNIKVVYEAWFNPAPDSLIGIVATQVGFEFSKELGQVVAREEMWPRSVEFFWSENSGKYAREDFFKTLRKFIPLHLRVW